MTRVEDPSAKRGYRLVGDVDYASASQVAGWITPVPGGVGPMTVTMLLANTVAAAESGGRREPRPARPARMIDVQAMKDDRRVPIQKVGVKGRALSDHAPRPQSRQAAHDGHRQPFRRPPARLQGHPHEPLHRGLRGLPERPDDAPLPRHARGDSDEPRGAGLPTPSSAFPISSRRRLRSRDSRR